MSTHAKNTLSLNLINQRATPDSRKMDCRAVDAGYLAASKTGSGEAMKSNLDIVVVTFRQELDMLALQLRSIDLFAADDLIRAIFVVLNDRNDDVSRYLDKIQSILSLYPKIDDKVRLIPVETLIPAHTLIHENGWRSQQAIKLIMSAIVETEFYLVLDTKNHFVRPVQRQDFISDSGKPYTHIHDYSRGSPAFLDHLRGAFEYFDAEMGQRRITCGLPAITPMVLKKSLVVETIREVERRGMNFYEAFLSQESLQNSTELLLYYAYLTKSLGAIDSIYEIRPQRHVTFFSSSPDSKPKIEAALAKLDDSSINMLGIHLRRYRTLSARERDKFKQIWLQANLFDNEMQCESFLQKMADKPQ
jgi:hypothetical protein